MAGQRPLVETLLRGQWLAWVDALAGTATAVVVLWIVNPNDSLLEAVLALGALLFWANYFVKYWSRQGLRKK